MINSQSIVRNMEVRDASGVLVGRVDRVDGSRIHLNTGDGTGDLGRTIDLNDVARVDSHVHLRTTMTGTAPLGARTGQTHAPARSVNWLAWLALLAGIIALIWWLANRSTDQVDTGTVVTTPADNGGAEISPGAGTSAGGVLGVSGLGGYLGGTDAAPRTFTFERINFASGSAAIREADRAELTQIAETLRRYPNARITITGYADAAGSSAANAELGEDRAEAIEDALAAMGIDDDRIETRSGGEANPVAANADAGGRAENRRTELTVTAR